MPSLGADMDRGTLLEWRVAPGDVVRRGDIVALVDTDKSEVEVEVFEDGTVAELLVEPGTEVPVGTPLARLDPTGPPSAAPPPAAPSHAPPAAAPAPAPAPETTATGPHAARTASPLVRHLAEVEGVDLAGLEPRDPSGLLHRDDIERAAATHRAPLASPPAEVEPPSGGRGPSASPYARRLAAEAGVDLAELRGTGPAGAVVARDVMPTAPPTAAVSDAPSARGGDKQASTRLAIARVMARSKREIPHFYLSSTIDLAAASRWLELENDRRPPEHRLLPASLLLRATALAAQQHPGINAWWIDDEVQLAGDVDLGVAISLRSGGVVTPSITDAAHRSLDDLMTSLRDLVQRARAGNVRSSELQGSITVTNLGDQGVDAVFGVINPPQVAIVGFGSIAERPVAHDGMLTVHPVLTCTLSADHRAVDGHLGSRFLRTLANLLQEPDALAADPDPGAGP